MIPGSLYVVSRAMGQHLVPPQRILHVVHGLGVGGAETWIIELLRHFQAQARTGGRRVQFDILVTGGQPDQLDELARELGATIFYIQFTRNRIAKFAIELRRLLSKGCYDAIHDHADYASGWHFLLGFGVLPAIVIAHVHNPWLHISQNYAIDYRRKAASIIGKWLVRRLATHVCGTSAEILRTYGFEPGAQSPQHVSVVHCGFDVGRYKLPVRQMRNEVRAEFGWNSAAQIILYAGRLDRALEVDSLQNHKNTWLTLIIAKHAIEKDSRIKLVMAGTGPSSARLETEIARWGRGGDMRLVGLRFDLPRLMRASDVLLFPSRQEGLGMVAVEAQAAGLPVLASTAVPKECVVIPSLFSAVSLDQPVEAWSDALLAIISARREPDSSCHVALENSEFSIQNSAARLEILYSGRTV